MAVVQLKNVVSRIKDFEDKDNTNLKYYVGGEHFDSRSLTINKKGIIEGSTIGPAFSTKFKPGDVLLMSRNPHLRKAGVVDFEGICSDVSYIIRTNDENVVRQRFIPLLFQSDIFWDFAEKHKKGSTNFFLNWSDFEKFEFDLPEIKKQDELCDVLWSINDTLDSYKEQLRLCDELVKAQFVEMFGDPILNAKRLKTEKLSKICPFNRYVEAVEEYNNKVWLLNLDMVETNTGDILDYNMVDIKEVPSSTIRFDDNCVLYLKLRPYLNKVVIPTKSGFATTELLSLNTENVNKYYLATALRMESFVNMINASSYGAKMPRASMDLLRDYDLPIPSDKDQNQFEKFYKDLDKSNRFKSLQIVTQLFSKCHYFDFNFLGGTFSH